LFSAIVLGLVSLRSYSYTIVVSLVSDFRYMLRPFHERPRNQATITISAGERKCRTIGLKYMAWHSVHLR